MAIDFTSEILAERIRIDNMPNFRYENELLRKGYKHIAGVDEVGRGCFAGPLVAAAVAFAPGSNYQFPITSKFSKDIVINDSKQLTPRARERAAEWIKKNAIGWGIGEVSVAKINRLGIKKASEIAFRKAIATCGNIDYLLVDAFYIPYVKGLRRKNQLAITKGDTKSISIAAASIIAKVYRDNLMSKLARNRKYKKYGWGRNKGYGTKEHQNAIQKYGTTRLHRKQFIETWQKKLRN